MRRRHTAPYEQRYRFTVSEEYSGRRLIDFYRERFAFRDENYWRDLITRGNVTLNHLATEAEQIIKTGDIIHTIRRDVKEPDVNDGYEILYEKEGLFIINKPAPLPVHASGRYYKNSLLTILREQYPQTAFHTIHRLDLWTTGVLILATEPKIARHLHLQIENQLLKKTYAVLAKGDFGDKAFTIDVPVGRKNGAHRGFGEGITEAKPSITEFVPLGQKDGVTLLKATPVTGRTNQIRVHIQAAGGHVLNDLLYSPEPPDEQKIDFMGLHCRAMRFMLPSNESVTVTAPWPDGFLRWGGAGSDFLDKIF